jgi:hypothetical protein
MICPECRGRGWTAVGSDDGDGETPIEPCRYCGGVTDAEIERSQLRIGSILAADYADDSYPKRTCEHCSKLYRGPAVYCSIECAVADA